MIFLWIFFPVTLILYYGCKQLKRQEILNLLLLFMSLIFYSFGEPKYLVLLLLSVIINFAGGLALEASAGGRRKAVLAVTVALNLGLLGYFKYYTFVADTVNQLAGHEWIPMREIALPIGISFYTFQAMSYVIDLYRGKCKVQRSFYKLLLYIAFFPQLIAGPIVRYRDIADQIEERSVDFDKFCLGITRFTVGLGKKVILANTFAAAVDRVFAMPDAERGMAVAWYGIVLYAMQIYFDFSGYSDMAIGMGKMFGFDFMENFQMPYISESIREFWRRWHISLSTWFKEYLYIPLGGNRKGTARTYLNLFIVFLVTGIWHGAGWTFIVWGLIHGFFSIAERLFLGKWMEKNPVKLLNHAYCLLVVLLAWVFFRADTLTAAMSYLGTMVRPYSGDVGFMEMFGTECVSLSAVGVLLCGVVPERVQLAVRENGLFRMAALPCMLFFCIMLLAADSYNPFIYFRF